MIAFFRFCATITLTLWALSIALVHFILPLYLLAIYPRVPEGLVRLFGVPLNSPAITNFWYRLAVCALFVALGLLFSIATLRAIAGKPSAEVQRFLKRGKR